jgi:hypothetical protein
MNMVRGSRHGRSVFRWPLFSVLAVVHLVVLPLVVNDRDDTVMAVVAGGVYLALAVADLVVGGRRRHRPAG